MSKIQAYQSVNVINFADIGALNLYLTSNLPNSIIYNPNQGGSYSPNWQTNNLQIIPVISYNGQNIALNSNDLDIVFTRKEGNNDATALISGETVLNNILTVSENKMSSTSNGQLTYICKVTYVDPNTGLSISAESTLTYSLISMAPDIKSANILGETTFLYDKDKKIVGSGSITLTADIINCSVFQWQFKKPDGTFSQFPTTNNPSVNGTSLIVKDTEKNIWINDRIAIIKLATNISNIYDIIQITKIYDGVSGNSTVSAVLTNENHVLAVDSKGNVKSWIGASTEIRIYEGGNDVTSQWEVTVSNSSNLSGTYNQSTLTYTPSNLSGDNGYADFICKRTGYADIVKRYTITKQYAGVDGQDAIIYELIPSTFALNYNGSIFSPSKIVFNSYRKQGNENRINYFGRFVISESTNGTTYSDAKYTSDNDEYTHDYVPSSSAVVAIKCILYASGGTTQELDSQTVIITKDGNDGTDGLSMGLGNYSDVIPCNTTGNALVASTITIPFYAYQGINKIAVTATLGTLPTGVTLKSNTAGTTSADGIIILDVTSDATFGDSTIMTGTISITLTAQDKSVAYKYTWTKNKQASSGTSAVLLQLYSEDSGTVEIGRNTTIKTIMYSGTNVVTPTKFVWSQFQGGQYTTISGQTGDSITITEAMVTDQMWLKCTATYDGKDYTAYYTVDDVTDELTAYTFSTISEFKNSQGYGAIYTRVYRNGVEVDPIKSTIFSDTAPNNPSTGDYYYHLNTSDKTCVLKKFDGSKWNNATTTEDGIYTYSYYRIDNTGESLDASGTAWKIGRCQYIDPSIISGRMQFICEVSGDK